MMVSKFKNLNQWMKIGIGLFAATIIFMVIGLGCFGAKLFHSTYYNSADVWSIEFLLKPTPPLFDFKGSDAVAFNTWRAGAIFSVILTPTFGGCSLILISIGYGLTKEKNNRLH